MKKALFVLLGAFMTGTSSMAIEPVTLTTEIVDDTPLGHGSPKNPITPPTVYIDSYILLFKDCHSSYTLYLIDENNNVAYSDMVSSDDTEVILPSSLSGAFTIILSPFSMSYCFVGTVAL